MGLPITLGNLVPDKSIARFDIRDSEQCLSQAHQRNTLLAGERILLDKPLNAGPRALGTQSLDEAPCGLGDRRSRLRTKSRLLQERRQALGLWAAVSCSNCLSKWCWLTNRRCEKGERNARSCFDHRSYFSWRRHSTLHIRCSEIYL